MVARKLLACMQTNRHEIFAALWNPYRREPSRGRHEQLCSSRGARGEKPENNCPPFWFYRESIRTSVHGSHIVIVGSLLHVLITKYKIPTLTLIQVFRVKKLVGRQWGTTNSNYLLV